MALIKCPECGKEISDKTSACINCGFPLSKTENTTITEETANKEVVYYDLPERKEELTFDNGLDDGIEGMCYERTFKYPYKVVADRLYITRQAGTIDYIIDGDFLILLRGWYDGYIPDGSLFNAICINPVLSQKLVFNSN